ncbi:MAG: glycosyltransferase family 2 protein [Proteobacteria bacterium]|nr:glycosyltransferase family 2 protein [Burkholderiales bacterium]
MRLVAELTLILLWVRMVLCCGLGVWAWRRSLPFTSAATAPPPSSRVSIVVPAFDEALHIETTLRSLVAQDIQPWEIIVIDDGSADATADIARRCLAGIARTRVIRMPVNQGKAQALNVGIGAASGEIVATIDADTRLEPRALGSALRTMARARADAVAFYLDVDNSSSLLGAVQRQEYVAALNFERAGQDVLGAISILPGAATLFTRESLSSQGFCARSCTEDADLTLSLSRRGLRMVAAEGAVASTVVPACWTELFAQRTRWITGHLQCCFFHAAPKVGDARNFGTVTFPNFLLSTLMAPVGFLALVSIAATGRTMLWRFDWTDAVVISVLLVYAQRACAWLIAGKRRTRSSCFLLEPFITHGVSTVCFVKALCVLLWIKLPRNRPA